MAVFRDFRWRSLEDFGTHNLIFGANGSGKTTISNALRFNGERTPKVGKLRLAFSDGTKRDLPDGRQLPHPFSVFNAAYVSENLLYQQGATAQTLYYIGAESASARIELDAAEEKLARSMKDKAEKSSAAKAAADALSSFGTSTARLVRTALLAVGDTNYTNFRRPEYFDAADAMASRESDEIGQLASLDRVTLNARASAPAMVGQPLLTDPFANAQQLAADTEVALNQKINLQVVLNLLVDPEVTQWLEHGTGFHRDIDYTECLFCARPDFPSGRRQLLERAFSTAYTDFQGAMNTQIRALDQRTGQLGDLQITDDGLIYEDLRSRYTACTGGLRVAVDDIKIWLETAQDMLEKHRQDPSGDTATLPALPSGGVEALKEVNRAIGEHNERCSNIQGDRKTARKALEDSLVAESHSEYRRLVRRDFMAKSADRQAATILRDARAEVQEWRAKLRDSIGAARGLESDVHHYSGPRRTRSTSEHRRKRIRYH